MKLPTLSLQENSLVVSEVDIGRCLTGNWFAIVGLCHISGVSCSCAPKLVVALSSTRQWYRLLPLGQEE